MDIVLRSLSAFSLLLLSSGLRLQQSTSNSSLRFPALDVDTGRDTQEGNWDTGPSWEQWRWESEWPESDKKIDLAVFLKTPIDATAFEQCAHGVDPLPDQFDATLDKEMAFSHMLLADHIYFLCVHCRLRKFPESWRGRISIVDGLESDKCLHQQNGTHVTKVTTVHKLIVWAAKARNFRTAMILEEDFILPKAQHRNNLLNHTALAQFIRSGTWDFLRFGHMPYDVLERNHCRKACLCTTESLTRDVCSLGIGCDIRSSVAYMIALREPIVKQFLEIDGVIDFPILQSFKQSFVVPAIFHQAGGLYHKEVRGDHLFRSHCLRD